MSTDPTGRIKAWHRIADHPFFEDCFASEDTLIDAMIAKLDDLMPKPWADAKMGEIWVAEIEGVTRGAPMLLASSSDALSYEWQPLVDGERNFAFADRRIKNARRLWPETEEEA